MSEVLIALAIIGVVSALTIPIVITTYQEKQTVAAVRKFYSEISDAYKKAIIDNGPPENWGSTQSGAESEHIMDILEPYLRIEKRCGAAGSKGKCFNNIKYKTLNPDVKWNVNPSNNSGYSTAKLSNGFIIWIQAEYPCNKSGGCGGIGVDVNGHKGPNALGRDTFYFSIRKYGIVPKDVDVSDSNMASRCNIASTNAKNGYGCASWIITKGNMDYLRKSVSW